MSEKLLGQLSTHVTPEEERMLKALAANDDKSPSVYLREIITAHLDKQQRHFESMQRVFGALNSMRTDSAE